MIVINFSQNVIALITTIFPHASFLVLLKCDKERSARALILFCKLDASFSSFTLFKCVYCQNILSRLIPRCYLNCCLYIVWLGDLFTRVIHREQSLKQFTCFPYEDVILGHIGCKDHLRWNSSKFSYHCQQFGLYAR